MRRFILVVCVVALSLMSFGFLSGCPTADSGTNLEDLKPGDVVATDGSDPGGTDTDDSGDDAEDADDSEEEETVEDMLEDD